VTVTIGGNDLNYVRKLMIATCGRTGGPNCRRPAGRAHLSNGRPNPTTRPSNSICDRLGRRSGGALRRQGSSWSIMCALFRLRAAARTCRWMRHNWAPRAGHSVGWPKMTKKAATAEGALLLAVGQLSKGQEACSSDPWGAGHPGKPADWHPTAAGHEAIAKALAARLN